MKLRDLPRSPSAPAWVGDIPAHFWAQTWADRPRETMRLGLRTLGDAQIAQVSSLADARARRLHPHAADASQAWRDAYNRALVALAVGRALCTAESADVPFWDYPDLVAEAALDPQGALELFAQLNVAMEKTSAIVPPDPVGDLVARLGERMPLVEKLSPADRVVMARLIEAAIDIADRAGGS